VALAYVSRPWCTPALLERVRAVARWDELREVQRAGRRGAALMMLASLLARPRRAAALAKLLQRRRALRAKAARAAAPIARTAT
jgi:hypothetical protein